MDTQKINVKVEVDTIELDKAIDKLGVLINKIGIVNNCSNLSDVEIKTIVDDSIDKLNLECNSDEKCETEKSDIKKKTIIDNSIDYSLALESKNVIDIDEIRRVKRFLELFNERDLRCFKFIEDNKFIEVSGKTIDKFSMTGLSNVDFIMSGEYKNKITRLFR